MVQAKLLVSPANEEGIGVEKKNDSKNRKNEFKRTNGKEPVQDGGLPETVGTVMEGTCKKHREGGERACLTDTIFLNM